MTDPSTFLAIASLSFQVFAGCIKGFVLITDAYNIGQDAVLGRTKLLVQEQRLIEWAKSVAIIRPNTEVDASLRRGPASVLLTQLSELLNSTEILKKRYKLELAIPTQANLDEVRLQGLECSSGSIAASSVLVDSVRKEARQSILAQASRVTNVNYFPKKFWWASVDKKRYERMVLDVTDLVDGLWSLLTPLKQTQGAQAINDILQNVIQISEDVRTLRGLGAALETDTATQQPALTTNSLGTAAQLKTETLLNSLSQEDNDDRTNSLAVTLSRDPRSLTGQKMGSSGIGIATYRDKPATISLDGDNSDAHAVTIEKMVIVEARQVDLSMKGKLRQRVADLACLLSKPTSAASLTLSCIGFTEEQAGFRMMFELPDIGPKEMLESPQTLLDSLKAAKHHPLPTAGFRHAIAVRLCATVLAFHTARWLHKDIRSENVMLFPSSEDSDGKLIAYLGGFSFARKDSPSEISQNPSLDVRRDIYRHPNAQPEGNIRSDGFQQYMDLYALGCVLIELAEWSPLPKIVSECVDVRRAPEGIGADLEKLPSWLSDRYVQRGRASFRLGAAFGRMVELCVEAGTACKSRSMVEYRRRLEEMANVTI
ncbi:MAG: hypothetical protein Q9162_000313 [Coniocarpon cinnabarinum]